MAFQKERREFQAKLVVPFVLKFSYTTLTVSMLADS